LNTILKELGLTDQNPIFIMNAPEEYEIVMADINRTKTWKVFAQYDFEPVSQVAIDDNWSAMRFRHVDNIKTLKRKTAAAEKGKERIRNNEVQ
jgi:hypothetical protein